MIVLDTNVLSELMRPGPSPRVLDWLRARPAGALHTTAITQAEILYGLRLLPKGRRRVVLERAAEAMFARGFGERILAFGPEAGPAYAEIATDRRRSGRPIAQADALIAAIVRSRRAALATRNGTDFDGCGIEVLDPWG